MGKQKNVSILFFVRLFLWIVCRLISKTNVLKSAINKLRKSGTVIPRLARCLWQQEDRVNRNLHYESHRRDTVTFIL